MGRTPCCNVEGLKKGAWTADEDQKLISYIKEHGEGGWRTLPQKAGLQRCGKSCRLRWANYLRPDIKRGEFSKEEEQKIIQLHTGLGNRWSAIARHLPKRTDNEIKNYWNTHLKKRQAQKVIDLVSHKPIDPSSSPSNSIHEFPQCEPAPDQPTSLKPTSSSAHLLNKIAAKLPPSACLETLKTIQSTDSISTEVDKDVMDVSNTCCTESPPSPVMRSPDVPRPVSTSARLLNKMASSLTHRLHCLNTLKSILSGSSDNHNFMDLSTSASNLSENASDMSRSISTSNGGINDQMTTHNFSPLMDSFDLDQLPIDWNRVSDGGVSSNSMGDTYSGWESPASPFNNFSMNNNNNNNAWTYSGCESMGTCSSGEIRDALTTATNLESDTTFGFRDQYEQFFTDGFSNFLIGDSHVVSACSGDSLDGCERKAEVFEEATYSWNDNLFDNYHQPESHLF